MSYQLEFAKQAIVDIQFHVKSGDKTVLKKLHVLLSELAEHPLKGSGKPEALKYELSGLWSRRINKEHRLIYQLDGDSVFILSVRGHYQ